MIDTLIICAAIVTPITVLGRVALREWRKPLQFAHEEKMFQLREAAAQRAMDQDRPVIIEGATILVDGRALPAQILTPESKPTANGHTNGTSAPANLWRAP